MSTPQGPVGPAAARSRRPWPSRQGPTIAAAVLAFLVVVGTIGSCAETSTRPAVAKQDSSADSEPVTSPASRPSDMLPKGRDGAITRHVDGDTIYVEGASVRLIGIDTPETVHPTEPVECYGRAASARLGALLPVGTPVRVVYDVERTDRYGRDLAYLYRLRDGLFVNAAMVRGGYAGTLTIPPNVRHADQFAALARQARTHDRGLWSRCSGEHDPLRTPPPPRKKQPNPAGNCAPGYDPCIPQYPPDLDCADVGGPIDVTGDDPHGLDADGDGVACE